MHGKIGGAKPGVEAFRPQVSDFKCVAVIGQALGDLRRDTLAQRVGIMMSDHDECVHGKTPADG